jgi:hypothetical protein
VEFHGGLDGTFVSGESEQDNMAAWRQGVILPQARAILQPAIAIRFRER